MPWITRLPQPPYEMRIVTLTMDTYVEADDLNRFIHDGGVIRNPGYRLIVLGEKSSEINAQLILGHGGTN